MINKDLHRLNVGLNTDDSPENLQPGEYVDALNMRIASSTEQQGVGVMETLQGAIEIIINASAGYYGGNIGGQFVYEGFEEVQIGDQVWMKNNWNADYPGVKAYNNDESNRLIYGGLYTWDMLQYPDFCPAGWHIPTESEIDILLAYLGGELIAGGKLKEFDIDHWLEPNTGATDEYSFRALPGGMFDSIFSLLGEMGIIWINNEHTKLLDYDGNEYDTVIIGTQEWIVQSLRVTHYSDGAEIPNLLNDADWDSPGGDSIGAYCWYDNDIANKNAYGALYNWYAANNVHGLIYFTRDGVQEEGWRMPTTDDFNNLIALLDPDAGGKMKETGEIYWDSPNTGADNSTGLSIRGGGNRNGEGFDLLREFAELMAITEYDVVNPGMDCGGMEIINSSAVASWVYIDKHYGVTIRAVRDV